MSDKVEGVKRVSEAMNEQQISNPADEMERTAPNKEQFQSFMNSKSSMSPSFQRVDGKAMAPETVQKIETNPVFANENVTSQKSGSATDQERKRRQDQGEIEEISGTQSSDASSATASSSSFIDEASKSNGKISKTSPMTPTEVNKQVKDLVGQIDQVKTKLNQVQASDIKPSYQTLLRNRLTHIDDNLKIALSKAGVEKTPTAKPIEGGTANPIERFMGYLTQSQQQLDTLHLTIEQLQGSKEQINPANMLAIQIKMGYIQQQIELFTSLLNKALESTKTVMNVQV